MLTVKYTPKDGGDEVTLTGPDQGTVVDKLAAATRGDRIASGYVFDGDRAIAQYADALQGFRAIPGITGWVDEG